MKTLVIVESPAKAKTISKFLNKDFIVKSSFGHIRDLPKKELGIDTDNNFEPTYVINSDKTKVTKELKDAAKKVDRILFATDQDREGEAISWHLAIILGVDPKKAERITFHEITKAAINKALESPQKLDMQLVDAQQTRRILDRLVGYKMSPFLWKKVARGLSAGRVQSVAMRLVVEREREIQKFKPEEYWSVTGKFLTNSKDTISGKLTSIPTGKLKKMDLSSKKQIDDIVKDLQKETYTVSSVEEKQTKRQPSPPFTTSTLQQEANHRLGFSAKQTMRVAQQLYEGVVIGKEGSLGLITYMRTDSLTLSEKFLKDSKNLITTDFGESYCNDIVRVFKNKSKNAQEAHEAIRPTEAMRSPEDIKQFLDNYQYRLYDLIWRRAVATQMSPAKINNAGINIVSSNSYTFRATGLNIIFDGFLKLYPEKTKENILPKVKEKDVVDCSEIKPDQHFTEPPARYSDATLVKILEEHGIGRPSTYAPTIATIESRGYVIRDEKKKLAPKDIAYIVNDLLVEHFPQIIDYSFTAEMENDLDDIAIGKKEWQPILSDFYTPFIKNLEKKDKEIDKKKLTEEKTDEICENCKKSMVLKVGRFGKFYACSGYPDCKTTKPFGEEAEDMASAENTNEKCENCGKPMVRKVGRFGPFLGCSGYPKCKTIKNIDKKLGVKCPKCKKGDIVERKTKRGKLFYSCNAYPKCEFALWDKPTGELCKTCGSLMVFDKKEEKSTCSNKECGNKKSTKKITTEKVATKKITTEKVATKKVATKKTPKKAKVEASDSKKAK